MNKHLRLNKKVLMLFVAFFCGIQMGWAQYYDFSKSITSGQTLYFKITDATNRKVAITCPRDPDVVFDDDDWEYEDFWKSYTRPTGPMVLPSSVTYSNKTYTVTGLLDYAFCSCPGITAVTFPSEWTAIATCAFYRCTGLTGPLTLPNSVTTIGGGLSLVVMVSLVR